MGEGRETTATQADRLRSSGTRGECHEGQGGLEPHPVTTTQDDAATDQAEAQTVSVNLQCLGGPQAFVHT